MLQILESQQGKMSVSCPEVFRHLMVDIISTTVFGSRSGAIDNYAVGIRDALSQAIKDFPTRGIVVRIAFMIGAVLSHRICPLAEFHPDMGLERRVPPAQRVMAAHLPFRQHNGRGEFPSCLA